MTFDSQVQATHVTALEDLRDKVGGMTDWGVVDDSTAPSDGGFVVFSTPSPIGEQVAVDSGYVANGPFTGGNYNAKVISIQTGLNWDQNNENWGTSGGSSTNRPVDEFNYGQPDKQVEYWLSYTNDKGFCWYVRQTEGDGTDEAHAFGYQLIETDFWDYHSANTSSGYAGDGLVSCQSHGGQLRKGVGQEIKPAYGGDGILNPDDNFANYVWNAPVVYHTPTANADTGFNPRCARVYPVWVRERSGSSINSGDVVQNSQGEDEYMVLSYHDTKAALSME